MSSVVLAHVDEFSGTAYSLECSLHYSFRASDKCHYGSVGGFARIHVKDLYSAGFFD
jgi:hypothetical protein